VARYPFDVLRAVSKVEPLTKTAERFVLRFSPLRREDLPKAASEQTRISKDERG
jgi:hypothetical protein